MIKIMLAVALLAAPSAPVLAPNSTTTSDAWPPVRFQGDNAARVLFVAPGLIDSLCGEPPAGFAVEACEKDGVIVLPNPCLSDHSDEFARLTCHEIGHIAGWPGTHGD